MLTFVLALSVGIAISVLLGWHIYLILTAQTTIEFYQNQTNRSRARQWGEVSEHAKARKPYNWFFHCLYYRPQMDGNILCLHHSGVHTYEALCVLCISSTEGNDVLNASFILLRGDPLPLASIWRYSVVVDTCCLISLLLYSTLLHSLD